MLFQVTIHVNVPNTGSGPICHRSGTGKTRYPSQVPKPVPLFAPCSTCSSQLNGTVPTPEARHTGIGVDGEKPEVSASPKPNEATLSPPYPLPRPRSR